MNDFLAIVAGVTILGAVITLVFIYAMLLTKVLSWVADRLDV